MILFLLIIYIYVFVSVRLYATVRFLSVILPIAHAELTIKLPPLIEHNTRAL